MSCSAKVRWAGVALKSYLSSGKSSAMAVSLRPMSFQESRTTLLGGSGGLTASFFMAFWARAGRVRVAAKRAAARRNGRFVIGFFSKSLERLADAIVVGLMGGEKGSGCTLASLRGADGTRRPPLHKQNMGSQSAGGGEDFEGFDCGVGGEKNRLH